MAKIKYTEREKVIIDVYKSLLENTRKKLDEANYLLALNKPYLKFKKIKFIKKQL